MRDEPNMARNGVIATKISPHKFVSVSDRHFQNRKVLNQLVQGIIKDKSHVLYERSVVQRWCGLYVIFPLQDHM